MYGSGVGSLWIVAYAYSNPNNLYDHKQVDLWYEYGNRGNKWQHGMVSIYNPETANKTIKIAISGIRGWDYNGDIAIDDIEFHNCKFIDEITPCAETFPKCFESPFTRPTLGPLSGDCNFEHGTCHWNNTAVNDMPWYLREGKTSSVNTGPAIDHTTGTSSGYYMHIEASWFVKSSVAILEGPYTMPTSNCNMTFYYHMSGADTGSLMIYVYSGDEVSLKFNRTGHQGDSWIKGEVAVNSDYAFRIHITATRGETYRGDIAIDDIKFQGQCTFTADQALKYGSKALTTGCSDGGREGFFQHPTVAGCKGWWWGRKNLRAKPSYVGVTCGDDIGTWGRWCSQPADLCKDGWHVCGTFGDVFEIVNRTNGVDCQRAGYGHFSAGINHCKTNNGGGDGCKRVKTGVDYGCSHYHDSCSEPLCCGLGCKGPDSCDSGVFKRQTMYSPASGDLEGCSFMSVGNAGGIMCCKDDSTTPTFPPPTTATKGSCDFESGKCDWIVDSTASASFTRNRGETQNRNTGPRYDHTKQDSTGYYLYMDSSQAQPKNIARVSYTFTSVSNSSCQMNFFYHMYGTGMGVLRLFVEPKDGQRTEVWKKAGNQGDGWYRGVHNFTELLKNKTTFTVSFEAERGPTATSDIAIDDITFSPCTHTPPGQCKRDEFRCKSGECIKSAFVCDQYADCRDHSDEGAEADCANRNCDHFQIYCPASGKCLNKTLQCNGKFDCEDGSDESHCECTENSCINGICQLDNFKRPDCVCDPNYNGARCQNCTNCQCPSDQIQCKVGRWFCTTKKGICDGNVKCGLSPVQFVKLCKACTRDYCVNGKCKMMDGNPTCECTTSEYVGQRCDTCNQKKGLVNCETNGKCVKIDDICDRSISCPKRPSEITKLCGSCSDQKSFCPQGATCKTDEKGFMACLCPFDKKGRKCEIQIPNNCTNQNPPLQPCLRKCVEKSVICSGNQTCSYPDDQIKSNCESSPGRTGKRTGGQKGSKSSIYIGVGVAAGIVLIVVVLVVAYYIMKSKKKKLTLFSVFYDPTNKEGSQIRKGKKEKGEIEMAEGVGNPVYDSFNEGQPLDDFHMSDVDTNMFASDDAFGISSDKEGATSMANPLYQDPYLEEDLN